MPGAERTLALISSLLTFVAAGILLIGCVGVSSGVSAWLDRKRHNIAILKSLGAPPPLVLRIYLVQVAGAAGIGAGAGLILGSVLYAAALPQLGDWLPVNQPLRATPLLAAGGFGFLAALLFSLPPLARSEVQRPQILFHSDLASCRGTAAPAAAGRPCHGFVSSDSTVRRRDALADRGVGVHHGRRTYGRGFSCWVA